MEDSDFNDCGVESNAGSEARGRKKSDPKAALEKSLKNVRQVITDIKRDVVEQNGVLYRIETIEKFEKLLEDETNKYVKRLNQEINKVVEEVIQGDTKGKGEVMNVPKLMVKLEDPELEDNVDLFFQIVSKHLAVERYL